jgi:hypothetical protein
MWSSRIRRRRLQGRAGFSRRRSVSLGNLQNHFTARTGSKKLDGFIKFNGWPLLRGAGRIARADADRRAVEQQKLFASRD